MIVDGQTRFSAGTMNEIMDAGNVIIVFNDTAAMNAIREGVDNVAWISESNSRSAVGYYEPISGPSASFYTGESDPIEATVLAYEWAHEALVENKNRKAESATIKGHTSSPHPAFASKHVRQYSTHEEYQYKLTVDTEFWKLADDGDNERDFWVANLRAELVPNANGGSTNYRNRYLKQRMDVSGLDGAIIHEYVPKTSTTNVNVDLSFSGLADNPVNISYNVPHTSVTNHSDKDAGKVEWEHIINWWYNASLDTMAIEPGLEFSTPHGTQEVWDKVDESATATFAHPLGLPPLETVSVRFDDGLKYVTEPVRSTRSLSGPTEFHKEFHIHNEYWAKQGQEKCLANGPFGVALMADCNNYIAERFEVVEIPDDMASTSETAGADHFTPHYFQIKSAADGRCLKAPVWSDAYMATCDPNDVEQLFTFRQVAGEMIQIEGKSGYCLTEGWNTSLYMYAAYCAYGRDDQDFFMDNF